ncbi:glycine cleavage T C-terminal barrel domain-containing protein [Thiomicrorhabdus sp. ZW0627]|uniref:glycine cleavage T C-terminal barrel domain-containing protein n=1 Tax=Thiomicrorhabdus sp. ZW0627 TaxID=3039774 RepID=UPI002436DDEF|nr:glycine cleavage T C-terminal barrel domain-containing protein [Thiomicrorhabdus sp. ZW0627]MDG6774339.1 glycine cleavage T C-terminal barrel domain-containing protein [Thiomicrorhabdus sp. ZW0627]
MKLRLSPQPYEWLDRKQIIEFEFEGEVYEGFKGDVISAALWANGVKTLGRSFKYHRRRGLLSLANHDINALFQSKDYPNIRGDVTPIEDYMSVRAVNTFGSLKHDKGTLVEWIGKFLPVGFYYKAFYSPKFLFPKWESLIRTMAGLGTVDTDWTEERKPKRYLHCDVAVIGAGPSGMAAALKAAEQGVDVCLIDENPVIGGSLDYQFANEPDLGAERKRLKKGIASHPKIQVISSAYVAGYYGDHWLAVNTPQGLIKVSAQAVVVATGVFEQPAVFRNNDLPGVMNASAAQRLISRYAVKPCNTAVVLTANAEGYRAALDMKKAGIEVKAILDTGERHCRCVQEAEKNGLVIYHNAEMVEATGKQSLQGIVFRESGHERALECDGLLMSVGWAPAGAPIYQAGGKFSYDERLEQLLPSQLPDGVFACGRINGVFDIEHRIQDGEQAGLNAALYASDEPVPDSMDLRATQAHSHPYPIWEHEKGKNFVDFDEDLQLKDLKGAIAQGFDNIELMKRFSTIGMGPSQGKHSNMNGIRILAKARGQSIDETGSTTARPMFHPTPVSHLAGMRFRPERLTAMHTFHQRYQAKFMEAGPWLRPEYYRTGLPRKMCIESEVNSVRTSAGLIDVSTLGKLEVFGKDAAELMDRLYTMRMSNMKVGASRYALMVDDSGVVIDDGVAIRYSEEHFYVTTTTTSSDNAYRMIQKKVIEWGLSVTVLNRTGQLAAMNLAGPNSRKILAKLTDLDLSSEAFPYLAMRQATVAGYPVTLIRVGFVGELGYEIHVDSAYGLRVWEAIMKAGEAFTIKPFGVEAQRLLRLEKGHIIVGQDTDGLTNPYEADMGWAVHLKKPYFIGKPSLAKLKEMQSRTLVGFEFLSVQAEDVPLESNLVIEDGEMAGRITSIGYSPVLGKHIGLAMVDVALKEVGTSLQIRLSNGRMVKAKVVETPFYDPQGLLQIPQDPEELSQESVA